VIFGFRFSYNINNININVKAPDEETTNVSKACDKQYIFAAENVNNSAAYHLCGQQICGKSVKIATCVHNYFFKANFHQKVTIVPCNDVVSF